MMMMMISIKHSIGLWADMRLSKLIYFKWEAAPRIPIRRVDSGHVLVTHDH